MSAPLLQIEDLEVDFLADEGVVEAVRGVTFAVEKGQTVALVGESGSGKTVISQAILGILPQNARIGRGKIVFRDPRSVKKIRDGDRGWPWPPLRSGRGCCRPHIPGSQS